MFDLKYSGGEKHVTLELHNQKRYKKQTEHFNSYSKSIKMQY